MKFLKFIKSAGTFDFKYLIIELIIVVCGILIAFWINTSWDKRARLDRENQYINALKIELQQAQDGFHKNIDVFKQDIKASLILLNHINSGPKSLSSDSLYSLLWQLEPPKKYFPRKAVLDDLIASGVLSTIESELLRRSIASYSNLLERDEDLQTQISNRILSDIYEVQVPFIDLSEIVPPSGVSLSSKKEIIELPIMKFNSDIENLFSRNFSNYLYSRINISNSLIESHKAVMEEIQTSIILIDIILGKKEENFNSISG